MSFRTQYDRLVTYSPAGSRIQPTYSLSVDDDGVLTLAASGQVDVYEKIQAFRQSVELSTILERYVTDGSSAIDVRRGFFADVTRMPTTLAGFFDQIHGAKATFDGLPVEIRDRFGHSLHQFVSLAGTPEWYSRLGVNTTVTPSSAGTASADQSVGGENIVP